MSRGETGRRFGNGFAEVGDTGGFHPFGSALWDHICALEVVAPVDGYEDVAFAGIGQGFFDAGFIARDAEP